MRRASRRESSWTVTSRGYEKSLTKAASCIRTSSQVTPVRPAFWCPVSERSQVSAIPVEPLSKLCCCCPGIGREMARPGGGEWQRTIARRTKSGPVNCRHVLLDSPGARRARSFAVTCRSPNCPRQTRHRRMRMLSQQQRNPVHWLASWTYQRKDASRRRKRQRPASYRSGRQALARSRLRRLTRCGGRDSRTCSAGGPRLP